MLLKPDIKLKRITDITPKILKKYGDKGLLLDVDNTMSTHHGEVLTDGLEKWLSYMQNSGIKLAVLSNSKEKRVKPFAEKIKLKYISLGLKPLPFGFLRGVKLLGLKRKETAIVGDQIFTDTLGGGIVGVKRILLTPIKPEKSLRFRFKRMLEKAVYKIYAIKDFKE
ncbi:MAG: YqeG family HAD IIIA-type phosphatase [Clostridia bacterium]|nr:YqeG family HAD IIIA-type phosphatase [Clostridia bacterium]